MKTLFTLTLVALFGVMNAQNPDNLELTITNKRFVEAKYQEFIVFDVRYDNHTGKDIRGVKGNIIAYDLFGDKLINLAVKVDEGIASGLSHKDVAGFKYNQFIEWHGTLKATELQNMTYEFIPKVIIYTDGTVYKAD